MSEAFELSMLFSSVDEEEQFIADGNLEELLEDYTPSKLSQEDKSKADSKIKNCRPMDILIGRFVSHPGNVLARKVIQSNREFFRTLDTDQRKEAVDCMIAFFERRSRFLEAVGPTQGSFRTASYFSVAEKFRKSLRETGIRADRPPPKKFKRLTNKSSKKKVAPVKVQRSVKANHARNAPLPPTAKSRARGGNPVGYHPREVKAGDRLAVYWPEDNLFYAGMVTRMSGTEVRFLYDDGDRETIDLSRESFVILGKSPRDRLAQSDAKENKVQPTIVTATSTVPGKLARRVSLPSQESAENSLHTNCSTDLHMSKQEPVHIHLQGTFKQAKAAAVPSLAAFLRGKLNKSSA